jgi:hypothetical protein
MAQAGFEEEKQSDPPRIPTYFSSFAPTLTKEGKIQTTLETTKPPPLLSKGLEGLKSMGDKINETPQKIVEFGKKYTSNPIVAPTKYPKDSKILNGTLPTTPTSDAFKQIVGDFESEGRRLEKYGSELVKFGKSSIPNVKIESSFDSIGKNTTKTLKSVISSINAGMPYKIIFLIAFFAIFYNVIFNICIFFGIDLILLNMYMGWVSFILILFTFLPTNYSDIFTLNKE